MNARDIGLVVSNERFGGFYSMLLQYYLNATSMLPQCYQGAVVVQYLVPGIRIGTIGIAIDIHPVRFSGLFPQFTAEVIFAVATLNALQE